MVRSRAGFVGRRAQLTELRRLGSRPFVTVVRGDVGSGKSATLARLGRLLRTDGMTVFELTGHGEPTWDPLGVQPLLSTLRERFEEIEAGRRLFTALRHLGGMWTDEPRRSPHSRNAERDALEALLGALAERNRTAFLIDDADRIPRPSPLVALARRAGIAVVLTATNAEVTTTRSRWPASLADRVVDLAPLTDEDVDKVIRHRAGAPADPALPRALRAELGDLLGNPGTLVSVLAELRAEGRLTVVHDQLCLRDPAAPIPLPLGHPLVERVRSYGDTGVDLVLLAASEATFGLAQLPAFAVATATPVPRCGRTLDRLVLDGVLGASSAGHLYVRHRALGAAIARQAGADRARRLHAAMAEAMLNTSFLGRAGETIAVEHAAAAEEAMPAHPRLRSLMTTAVPMAPRSPENLIARGMVRRRQVGLDSPARSELIRLLIRSGRYERLAALVTELVSESASAGRTTDLAELAAAGALAAIHLGRRLPSRIREVLATGNGATASEVCDRWFTGAPFSPADVERAFAVLASDDPARRGDDDAVATACAMRDLVPVFEATLGDAYGAPTTGPLAAHHRLCRAFAEGRWSEGLSAAREVVLNGTGDRRGTDVARLLAAEMCVWRGADRQAVGWLDSVSTDTALGALRGWVDSGRRYRAGDAAGAIVAGWSALRRDDGSGPGRAELLSRLAVIAVEQGAWPVERWSLAKTAADCRREGGARMREAWLLVQGLLAGDTARVRESERLARRRGHRPDRVWASFAAGLVADEPRGWFHESYRLAGAFGAPVLRSRLRQAMTDRGVAVPATRARPDEFSEVERRIIELVRSGKSNREIAATVVISEKTVEKHLTKLYLKTGCRSRHELAAASLGGRLERMSA